MSTVAAPRPCDLTPRSGLDALPQRLTAPLVLAPLCAVLFFHGLAAGDLYRTESLRAIIAQEFLNSGNWVVPTLYGEPLLTKPPGMYAAIALVSAPFGGVTTWSARLPSALAAMATVLLLHGYARRQLGRLGGLVTACIVPTSVMWLDKATTAEIDMLQVFWVVASLVGLFRAIDAEEEGKSRRYVTTWWLAALLAVAGGTLTKWTAPAFFYLTALPLLFLRGQLRALVGGPHLLAAVVAAALVLGWAVLAVRQVGWETFFNTVSQEACQRLVPNEVPLSPPRHHHRPYPWLEVIAHPFVTFGACLPWSPFALLTLWPGFARLWDERGRRWLQALHCWLWPNLLFWSIVPEHAPRHSFPFFPAVAGLAGMAWLALLTGRLRWPISRLRPAGVFVALVALWVAVKIGHVHAVIPQRGQGREPQAKGEQLAALVPPGQPLFLCRLKDEGILFYYSRCHPPTDPDRIVRRLPGLDALLSTSELAYGIVTEAEWQQGPLRERAEVVQRLRDQQGDPILLVRVRPR